MDETRRLLKAAAAHKIKGKAVGEIEIKFKEDFWWWVLIPFKTIATTLGKTIWVKSRNWYYTNEKITQRVVLHECVHVFDYVRSPLKFLFRYAMPQIAAITAVPLLFLSIGSESPWAVVGAILALFLLAPWPSFGRARLEQRAYTVEAWSIRISMIENGLGMQQLDAKNKALHRWLSKVYRGKSYYWMVWGNNAEKWANSIIANAGNNRQPISEEMMCVIRQQ